MSEQHPTTPSDVSEERSWLDRLADTMSNVVSRPSFFLLSVGFILGWAVAGPYTGFSHRWVDVVQMVASLVTFSMVALLQNEGWRGNKATQRKLNAIASALAEVMQNSDVSQEHVRQLNSAVGVEKRESTTR